MNLTPLPEESRNIEFVTNKGQTFEAARNNEIVSGSLYFLTNLFIGYWIVLLLSSLGVVTNSLVMVVFLRQGFRDSVNVSLFSIAVWDEVKCLAAVIFRLDKPIGLINPVWGINWRGETWQYLMYLPIFSGYVSYALATYVSLERCLSVSIPFTVKSLITPRLTATSMVVLSLFVFGSFSPVFFIYTVEYRYSPIYNTSLANVTLSKLYYTHDEIISKMYKVLGILYPAVFCSVMIATSAIIVFHLRKSAENFDKGRSAKSLVSRIAVGHSTQVSNNITPRDVKVTKMLLVIIFVYVMDFFPRLSALVKLKNVWYLKGDKITKNTKLKLYKALVKSVLTYNCGTWAPTQSQEERLNAFHRKQLKNVLNIKYPVKITNSSLYNKCNERPLSIFILESRWRLFGHILRRDSQIPANQSNERIFRDGRQQIQRTSTNNTPCRPQPRPFPNHKQQLATEKQSRSRAPEIYSTAERRVDQAHS
ncbi:endonuclease-reverse transcriptase [Elysia marginata]|uniref:Endonuclease-reverse transcriptase n=1 Tax=Elysia marginata TaxID=1093978 RepID=A0AAV4IKE9_9GAST|nr:endonuclease-reverse transcriptase [Elysia marginata]